MNEENSSRPVTKTPRFTILGNFFVALAVTFSIIGTVYASNSPISIDAVSFSSMGKGLRTLTGIDQEVYLSSTDQPVEVRIDGHIQGVGSEKIELVAIVLPTLNQIPFEIEIQNSDEFSETLSLEDLSFDVPIQILIFEKNTVGSESRDPVILNFILREEVSYPNLTRVFWEVSRSSVVLIFLGTLFLLALVVLIATSGRQSGAPRFFLRALVVGLLILLVIQTANQVILRLAQRGLILLPESTLALQKRFPDDDPSLTLTRLNENLELEPSLSSSWSNISPNVWEFAIRNNTSITAGSILEIIKRKKSGAEDPYLSSLESIVSVNEDRLQFLTKFPDPLLPQKLTKVDLQGGSGLSGINVTDEYLPDLGLPGGTRSSRNQNYSGLPFLSESPLFKTELIEEDRDVLKGLIEDESIDIFDEPEPILWPTLSIHGYQIEPKINTRSALILVNRNDGPMRNMTLIAALKKILNSTQILQTSYFQYGRLANQFAPPGVVGYDPEMEVPTESRSVSELVEQAKTELDVEQITLRFSFPDEEQILAGVIMKELDRAGIQTSISDDSPDITLLTVDFNLGDVGPFLDALIDSNSPLNKFYKNGKVDEMILQSRSELNSFNRLELLQEIMKIIIVEDPAGIPLLFKKSFVAKKIPVESPWYRRWAENLVSSPHTILKPYTRTE